MSWKPGSVSIRLQMLPFPDPGPPVNKIRKIGQVPDIRSDDPSEK